MQEVPQPRFNLRDLGLYEPAPVLRENQQRMRVELARAMEYMMNPGHELHDFCMQAFADHPTQSRQQTHDRTDWDVLDFELARPKAKTKGVGWLYQERLNVPGSKAPDQRIIFLGIYVPEFGSLQVEYLFRGSCQRDHLMRWEKGVIFTGAAEIHPEEMRPEEIAKIAFDMKHAVIR